MLSTTDPTLIKKFINLLMLHGEKNRAYKIFCAAGYQFLHSLGKNDKLTAVSSEKTGLSTNFLIPKKSSSLTTSALVSPEQAGATSVAKQEKAFLSLPAKKQQKKERGNNSSPTQGLAEQALSFKEELLSTTKVSKERKGVGEFLLLRTQSNPIGASTGVKANLLLFKLGIAIENVKPSLECKKCRIAGASRLVPSIVSRERGRTLAVRWIIEAARERKKKNKASLSQCLAQELLDAYGKQGRPRQRRDQYHKLAEGNRGYLRYRWW